MPACVILSSTTSVVISDMDRPEVLNQNHETVRNSRPLSEAVVASLLTKTTPVGSAGQYEWFKGPDGLKRPRGMIGTCV